MGCSVVAAGIANETCSVAMLAFLSNSLSLTDRSRTLHGASGCPCLSALLRVGSGQPYAR